MDMTIINDLQNKDCMKAHALFQKMLVESASSNIYYSYFDEFLRLIHSNNSYIRTRGFVLCMAQARWDKEKKIEASLEQLCILLHDKKPTVVRQCLQALHEVILFQPEIASQLDKILDTIDLSNYKDSMAPLIQKDIEELRKIME